MAHHSPIRRDASSLISAIPDKLYFRIGEVARVCEVPAYVLRFWESEFPQLRPNKGGTGQRLFRRRDVEMALRIKSLLYDEGYTIPGARQLLKGEAKHKGGQLTLVPDVPSGPAAEPLQRLRAEMVELLGIVSRPVGSAEVNGARFRAAKHESPRRARTSVASDENRTEKLFELEEADRED